MFNMGNLLRNAAGIIGSAASNVIGGVVNLVTPIVSAAATLVDGAIVGVGEGVVTGAGATVTGVTGLIDILCGYIRGAIGTIGGYLNNGVHEIVKVVGGEETAKQLPADTDFKKFFGEFGSAIAAAFEKSGGLDGVRSILAWPSKIVSWGGFKPFPELSDKEKTPVEPDKSTQDKPEDNQSTVEGSPAEDKPAENEPEDSQPKAENQTVESEPEDNQSTVESLPAEDKPAADGILVWVDTDGNVVPVDVVDGNLVEVPLPSNEASTQSTDLSTELLDNDGEAASQPHIATLPAAIDTPPAEENVINLVLDDATFDQTDIPSFDGFVTQANDNLFDAANTIAAVA